MQLPKEELDRFLCQLSPDCRQQFVLMLHGRGRARHLHRYGGQGCGALGGAVCATQVHVRQRREGLNRLAVARDDVAGSSCLPKSCIQAGERRKRGFGPVAWMKLRWNSRKMHENASLNTFLSLL